MRTMEQRRAEHALRKVAEFGEISSEFMGHLSSLPYLIHANGLGQAVAFFQMKRAEDASYAKIIDALSDWLRSEGNPYHGAAGNDILAQIAAADMTAYMAAQAEAMQYLTWLKKLAKARQSGD